MCRVCDTTTVSCDEAADAIQLPSTCFLVVMSLLGRGGLELE